MSEKKISIIVPIYNVEKYLNKCVESIVNQTYKNLEIILVDDGSVDNCPAICDMWAKKDSRVKVIHKQNGGLSDARNFGLDIMQGEYVAFVDSDDYVEKDYIEKLYSAIIQNNADLAVCDYNTVDETYNILDKSKQDLKEKVYNAENKFDYLFCETGIQYIVAWNKLYNIEIFKSLRYVKNKIHEDEYIIYDVINHCKNIVTIRDRLYNYLIRANSITGSKQPNIRMLDAVDAFKYRLSKLNNNSKYFSLVLNQYFYSFVLTYNKVKSNKELRKIVIERYNEEYRKYSKFLKAFKNKLKYFLFRYFKKVALKLLIK